MNNTPNPESLDPLVNCLAWYYSFKEITREELEKFIKGIVVEEPDPGIVKRVHDKYCETISSTAETLAIKWNLK
jgi:hypothetical protein